MTITDPLDRVHTNPLTLARSRERIGLITEAARRAGSYVAGAAHRPVFPTADAVAGLNAFRRPLQDEPLPPREVLAELDTFGSPATAVVNDGRHYGLVTGGTDLAAEAAAILAGTWDQNAGAGSPVASVLDEVAGGWVIDALGLPSTAVASFNAGATVANLTGIIAGRDALYARQGWDVARDGLAGAPALRIVVGEEVHASALTALRLAGFGRSQIERVPTDADGAVRADAFPADTDGRTLVLLQAGHVDTGASDPFEEIIPDVRDRGGWVHVDGAFGLWAAASPRLRHLVAGVELADSWATDARTWLGVPYDSGILVVRDPAAAPAQAGIEISPPSGAIAAWATLASCGRRGLAERVERTYDLAQRLADALEAAGATVLAPVALHQVLVGFGDAAQTAAVIAAVERDGTCWADTTQWKGRRAMRVSVSDVATTADDVDASAAAILRCWEAVRA